MFALMPTSEEIAANKSRLADLIEWQDQFHSLPVASQNQVAIESRGASLNADSALEDAYRKPRSRFTVGVIFWGFLAGVFFYCAAEPYLKRRN